MTSLSERKKQKIYEKGFVNPTKSKQILWEITSFTGTLASSSQRNQFESLYNRAIIKSKKGMQYAIIKLSETLHEISWWKNNTYKVLRPIQYLKISSQFTQMLNLKAGCLQV